MIVKHYGIQDTIAKEIIRTITSQNDDTARRAVCYLVRDPKFDKIAGKDYVLVHLYDFDSSTGLIVAGSNDVKTVAAFATAMAEYELEVLKEAEISKEVVQNGKGKKGN